MGFLDSGAAKAIEKQRLAIIEEARKASLRITEGPGWGAAGAGKATIANAFKNAIGGSWGVEADAIQTFRATPSSELGASGLEEIVVIQPYSGGSFLPGEMHADLPGTLPLPLALVPPGGFGGFLGVGAAEWKAPRRSGLTAKLDRDPRLARSVKRVKLEARMGQARIELDWAFQLYANGDGTTHVVFQYAQYGVTMGWTATYGIGFSLFVALVDRLAVMLEHDDEEEPRRRQRPMYPVLHADVHEHVVEVLTNDHGAARETRDRPVTRRPRKPDRERRPRRERAAIPMSARNERERPRVRSRHDEESDERPTTKKKQGPVVRKRSLRERMGYA